MSVSRAAVRGWRTVAVLAFGAFPLGVACSSGDDGAIAPGPTSAGQSGSSTNTAGAGSGSGSVVPTAGASTQGGATSGGASGGVSSGGVSAGGLAPTGGMAGAGDGAGTASGGACVGGPDDCDTPPTHTLNVTAAKGEHVHGKAGVDTRATKILGKLVVDIGVNAGGYSSFLAKRGYHSMGAPCGACAAPNLDNDRDTVGTCRLGEFATTEASVKSQLTTLQAQYPEEDWGYFLKTDGNVRWSDVAITGISHGATTAAIAGRLGARMWRIVSRSGPRDNTCGLADGKCKAPLSTPSYDAACADADVAAWLDAPSKTPIERFYGIVGMGDGQCGDIMFNMHRTKYLGVPTIFDNADAVLTGTNQFFAANGGHDDFLAGPTGNPRTDEVLNIAFGIPPENQHPAF